MPSFRIENLSELEDWTKEFVKGFSSQQIVLLKGQMGSGKTELVRHAVKALGGKDVASPSFALHHRYEINSHFFVDHIDLYRIQDDADLESLGLWDIFSQQKGLIFIEWAEKLSPECLPPSWDILEVSLKTSGEVRKIESTSV